MHRFRTSLKSQKSPATKPGFSGSLCLEEPMWPTFDNGDEPKAQRKMLADRLARETGISEEEAERLIQLIGTDWNSLRREARFLKGRHEDGAAST
ncbi:hypothetical protein [Mesorhizobium huakuii]|uniref:DUF3606 domain-containing protein n=1 Tax=Mesorhizobium huakuii TaxID=28104 RepID=A0ABZ0VKU1_9HYPH|nr:hypothetical protein [Mesorhizobium huakuii]WQB97578.1 hypothetical protein U0R22_001714 [Mesorhizobium huakuii]